VINKQISFSINTYKQAREVVEELKKYKVIPILHIKNYIIQRFGIEWIISLKKILEKDFPPNSIKFSVDAKSDYGLSINLANNKINFIKLKSDQKILKKIEQICKKNRVLLNQSFRIIDLSNIKNINIKLSKIFLKDRYED
tara:strand:- start:251 stop:673 length:423 start_codon:yes stop_codon:yes gene_type:complete